MENPGFKGQIAKFVAAGGLGLAIGFGTLVAAHAATSPSPSVSPDVGTTPSTSPGTGSGTTHNCPNM